jgi:cytidine deaminase
MTEIADFEALRAEALEATTRSYAPYSGFRVGAAALVDDGEILTGCNVENASYGLSLCAECGIVSALYDSGGGKLLALSVVDSEGRNIMPCGRCRQLLFEAGGPDLLIDSPDGPRRLDSLLPDAFSEADLETPPES